ncbi:carbamoyl-phosphate synthase large subunit [Gemmiger sp.]|uniref:carbamoyl-phosphate synthase large subunit n=1 Tax=Gemmiger sp. TaxID=2049027 RepID=UPI003AB2F5C1
MPLNPDLHKVMIIGSGPIVIGQAAEFDYAGSQACRALKDAGLEVVLVNPNPATIMTDHSSADHIYIEPLTLETLRRIILKEKPDSLLSTLGGQSGLTLSMQLAKEGFLEQHGVKLLGAKCETIEKAEDRQQFKDTMLSIHQPVIPSEVVETVEDALAFAQTIGYPVIVRPAYTLGGSGGGICQDEKELAEIAENGLRLSPITQILVEKCISGWKEIEFEVMRDKLGNVIAVCSMENIDPVGVHTGDSIVVAPALTLADKEYQMLRRAALDIITALEVEGGCNCQFALNPDTFDYAVIEVNPRVSRSSALASKATGYPIAKCAAQIAIGYTLDEMKNAVTGKTCAAFEPALDYIVAKIPKWPFDKFVYGKRTLGTQMKATGEVMAIGVNVEQALMKAVRGAEIGCDTLRMKSMANLTVDELLELIGKCTDQRMFAMYEAIARGVTLEKLHEITKIDYFFLHKYLNLYNMECRLKEGNIDAETYLRAKKMGYPDKAIERLSGEKVPMHRDPVYKMVDTCAAEFAAETPYFYATYDDENEAKEFLDERPKKPCVVVLGSGPIRIGQGIEFDYCSVHAVWTLKQHGCEAILVNNNPETVSTDFDTGDRLYFDPLNPESVDHIIETEKPDGCLVQFGGQTAIKLAKHMDEIGLPILGTPADAIDEAEDRERFDELLERCGIPRPEGRTVFTLDEALQAAQEVGYPVLMRPSYVLGGQNMIVAYNSSDVIEYMGVITKHVDMSHPVLMDKYILGTECEVDAICDGTDYLVPGIMQQVERTGVHSGDSICVYPPTTFSQKVIDTLVDYTGRFARELKVVGLVNVQYAVQNDRVYVIEVNPRSSRTVPYISKVTGVPMVDLAVRCTLGEKLKDMGYGTGLWRNGQSPYYAVKVPVYSFLKLHGVDTMLGPEMKSTGEVLGIAPTFHEAMMKGLVAAGYQFKVPGPGSCVIISVKDSDKAEAAKLAWKLHDYGYKIYGTPGTAKYLNSEMIPCSVVRQMSGARPNVLDLLESGLVDYIISTSPHGRDPHRDSVKFRRKATELSIPTITAMDTASVLVDALRGDHDISQMELVDIANLHREAANGK